MNENPLARISFARKTPEGGYLSVVVSKSLWPLAPQRHSFLLGGDGNGRCFVHQCGKMVAQTLGD
jgi:hypothetical protein